MSIIKRTTILFFACASMAAFAQENVLPDLAPIPTAEEPELPWNIFRPSGYNTSPKPVTPAVAPQDGDDKHEEKKVVPAPTKKSLPKPVMSVAQVLGSTSLSRSCVEDFTNVFGKSGFSMASFAKELVTSVAKTKLQLKSPFGKPKDGDMTSAGLTVGCIKTLPESPAEIQSLLKDIALKAGLDFAVGATTNFAENSIPTNIKTEIEEDGVFKTAVPIGLIAGGLGTLIYGFMQNNEVVNSVNKRDGKAAVDARSSRNISYGIGAGLLAGGSIVYIVF